MSKEGAEFTTLLPPAEIRQLLEGDIGPEQVEDVLSGQRSVVTSCGSGMTAGVLWLGLHLIGTKNVALYDEVSWCLLSIMCKETYENDSSRGLDMP